MAYEFVDEPARYEFVDEPPKESLLSGVGRYAGRMLMGGPLGAAGAAINDYTTKMLNKAAYEGGGIATDVAAKFMPPEAAAGVGLAANVGIQSIPMFVGGMIGKAAQPSMEASAKRVMQSALKPTIADLRTGKAASAIDTLLKEGANVTPGGVAKLRAKIYNLNGEITKAVEASPATIDKRAVAEELRGTLDKFTKQVNPGADTAAIESAWTQFLQHPLLAGKNEIPVQLAQEMKQGTYRALGQKSYGELKGASTEAQKALARGLKNEISAAVPEVAALNKSESELLNALSVAERRVLVGMNNNPMSLSLLTDSPGKMALFLADKSDAFKSIFARMLNAGSERIPVTVGQVAGGALNQLPNSPQNKQK